MTYNAQLSAALSGSDTLIITAKRGFWAEKSSSFRLYENGREIAKLKAMSRAEIGDNYLFTVLVSIDFVPGNLYEISDCKNEFAPVDTSYLARTSEFDARYRCDKPQGAIYAQDKTTFRLFSPLANWVVLTIRHTAQEEWQGFPLTREECGCWSLALDGDWDKAEYFYIACIDGRIVNAADPWGYSANTNSRHSFVIDPAKVLATPDGRASLKPLGSLSKSIIYECHVRDMTSRLDLEDRGTYAALSRKGLTYGSGKDVIPAGLDYIASLGVTHVQFQPVQDYQTVDDAHPLDSYNWGYDPLLYFVPEGSMCSDPEDPYARVLELRAMAAAFHHEGIRINYDVVYNHVFDTHTNPLDILCPGYYFRFNSDGNPSNGSFCGNDLESRHYMCRRLIIESMEHLVTWYGADGFRFDLMGIIDMETIRQARERLCALNKEIMLYGEGWNMPTALPSEERTNLDNAKRIPEIGFFSDFYRDIAKGATSSDKMGDRGYLTGDLGKREDFKFAYAACCLNLNRQPTFARPTQCLSYVECHDNSALMDKLKACCPGESDEMLLRRVKLCNAAVALSCGIPFFHAGCEIGQDKHGVENSFCSGDAINGFDYALALQRRDMIRFFQNLCLFRSTHSELCFSSREELVERLSFCGFGDGCLMVTYNGGQGGFYHVLINPSTRSSQYSFPNYVKVVLTETGIISKEYDFYSQLVLINGLSIIVCYQRADGTSGV